MMFGGEIRCLSTSPDKKKQPNAMNMWECKKVLTLLLSLLFLIGLNSKFYEISAKQHVFLFFVS